MAEEPQPSTVHEGALTPPPPSGSAEDRKAAAALSSLDSRHEDENSKNAADTGALDAAMKNLEVSGGNKQDEKTVAKKVVVKIDAADVGLLVDQLELSKPKATELLRAHDGDATKAITAFIKAPA